MTSPTLPTLDTLAGNLHHLNDAWARRDEPNVVLLHYQDLQNDLAGQMRELADRLTVEVPAECWPELVSAARFDAMKDRPIETSPDHLGVFKDRRAFFRSGGSGDGEAACSSSLQVDRYRRRAAELATPDVLAWRHRDVSW